MNLTVFLNFRSERNDEGCLIWKKAHDKQGYGVTTIDGKYYAVHILAYEVWIGDIPEGFQIDHLCFIRDCIEPTHLEAVTPKENNRRKNARITHCPYGHEYTEDNTGMSVHKVTGVISKWCRICKRRRHKEWIESKRR